MVVMYQRPSTPSPEQRRRAERRRARERNQKRVRWVFVLANIVAIVFMVLPVFTIVGFFAGVGTGVVLVVVVAVSYLAVNKTVSVHPALGLLVSVGAR